MAATEPKAVGYGELDALLVALQLTKGDLVYLADDDKVRRGWVRQVWKEIGDHPTEGPRSVQWAETWWSVHRAARLTERRVIVLSVESHAHWQDIHA